MSFRLIYFFLCVALALDPVIGAISGGKTVGLKTTDLSPASSSFLASTVPRYLDSAALKVIEGGHDAAEQLLQQKWDKIFFTGNSYLGHLLFNPFLPGNVSCSCC